MTNYFDIRKYKLNVRSKNDLIEIAYDLQTKSNFKAHSTNKIKYSENEQHSIE